VEQKEKTEKIISDKDLFDSIYSNKSNIWGILKVSIEIIIVYLIAIFNIIFNINFFN
jgi:hypothetical protein